MTFYRLEIGAKARSAGRFIGRVRAQLLNVLVEEKSERGMTQQELSEKLQVHRQILNQQLTGSTDLTLNSLAEIAWALDRELHIEFRKFQEERRQNEHPGSSTAMSQAPRLFGRANAYGETVQAARVDC